MSKLSKKATQAKADLKTSISIARNLGLHDEDVAFAARLVFESCFFPDGKLDDAAVKNLELAASVAVDLVGQEDAFELVGEIFDDG